MAATPSVAGAFLNLQAEKYEADERQRERQQEEDEEEHGGGGLSYHGGPSPPSASSTPQKETASRRLHFLLSRLQMLLGLSSKESTKAFFYGSSESLQWTQRLMLRLWSYLLSQVDYAEYRHQPSFLETLHLLMLRGEFDWSAFMDSPPSLLARYQRTLWDTTGYVIGKLNRKAAPTEVRVFCSQVTHARWRRGPWRHSVVGSGATVGCCMEAWCWRAGGTWYVA